MKRLAWLCISVLILSGCTVRTYKLTRDRVDQDLTYGNQSYLVGKTKPGEAPQPRKTTRDIQVVEVEMKPLFKGEKGQKPSQTPAAAAKVEDTSVTGNRGYMTDSYSPELVTTAVTEAPLSEKTQDYTVASGDTLQKIAQKFYGSSKKWYRIYKANQDILKGPDKIYPGQTIRVPVEAVQETKENLK